MYSLGCFGHNFPGKSLQNSGNKYTCVMYKLRGVFFFVIVCREISAETERESQQLQNYWSEVRYMVRCIYRQAGTPLADDQDQSLVPDKEGMKELVDRYRTSKKLLIKY